jgi:hypothetical protein
MSTYSLPTNKLDCQGHSVWDVSKRCVLCDVVLTGPNGAVYINGPLFRFHGCQFIRACPIHFQQVCDHFSQPEFAPPYNGYQIVYCPGCGSKMHIDPNSDDQSGFCNKGCRGNWLDRRRC